MAVPTVDRISLSELLTPVGVEEFAQEYWGRRPLLLTGRSDRFAGLFDRTRLWSALRTGQARIGSLHPADPDLPLTAGHTEDITIDEIEPAMAAGHTICITDLSAAAPELARLAADLVRELGVIAPARVNAFWSPPGSGAEVHLDARVTTSLQLEGAKQWWYGAAPAVAWPRSNAQLLPDGEPVWMYPWCGQDPWERLAAPGELAHVLLQPGDLLCLPAGTWHAARADDRSLALNVSFSPPEVTVLIREVLSSRLAEHEQWRGALPSPSPGGSGAPPTDRVRDELAGLLDQAGELLHGEAAALRAGRPGAAERTWSRLCGRRERS